jgi:multidrug efflux pump
VKITEVCIRKPILAWMLMAGTVIFGVVALTRIGISQYPDVDNPVISISVTREGSAPEAMEHDVVEPLEEAVLQIEGVRTITSTSQQGSAGITVELDLDRNVDVAMQDVQARVSQTQRLLPRDVDPPVISKSNPEDQPIMWVGLSGPYSQQVISDIARYRVKPAIQTVPGVGEINLGGGYVDRNVRVWIDAHALEERRLTVADVIAALTREHVELPAGRIEAPGREINVRVLGEALDLEAFRRIVVREADGAAVYLEDVALVEDGFEDVRRLSRVNGEPAQGLGVRKQRGSNAVAVAQGVRERIADLQKTLPEGMVVGINFDSSKHIEESVAEMRFELLLAIGLTALVCWMFLGSFSSTLNVVLAIPMSLLGTIAVIYFLGYTLNTFSLLALSLAVGIVVDDAIMVLENIFRHAEGGKDRVRAAREGTAEITFAALAATIAVIAIFLPVVFMEGVVGRYFMQFGVTLSVAVFLSYIEAITLAPARCAQFLKTSREHRSWVGRKVDAGFERLARLYERLLGRALRYPVAVLAGAILVCGASVFVLLGLPREMVPSQDQSRLFVRLQTAVGSSLEETDRLVRRGEEFLLGRPEVERLMSVSGGFGGSGVNGGIYFVTLVPAKERKLSQNEFAALLRRELNGYPGFRAFVQDPSQAGFSAQRGFPIEFSVRGPDWDKLVEASQVFREKLEATGMVTDLDTDYRLGMPELRIVPDRGRAADLGVSVQDIASTVNALVGGERIGRFSTGGRRVDVRVRLLAEQRRRPEDLVALHMRSASGALVPLASVVDHSERPALQSITRKDRERAISFFANVAPGHSQSAVLAKVNELGRELPVGYHAKPGGASVVFAESMFGLAFALVLGIIVAYMVLASQFNSLLHPFTVLTILPLAVVGAAFALLIAGKTLNVFSMIGLLLLLGIVKKNSIILVDYANQVRAEGGLDAADAMRRAGPIRLRPILMTSTATMMAALPSALQLGPGGEVRAPIALSVIGGLVVSTALSLLVVPAFYVVADRARLALRRRRAAPVVSSPGT